MYVGICIYIYIYTHIVYMYRYMYRYMFAHRYGCIYIYIYIYVCILGRGVHHGVVLPRETILKTGSVVNTCCKYIKECNRFKNIIQNYKEY